MKHLSPTIKNGNRYTTGKRRKGGSLRSRNQPKFLQHRRRRRALEKHMRLHYRDKQAYRAWIVHFFATSIFLQRLTNLKMVP